VKKVTIVVIIAFFYGGVVKMKKKTTTTSIIFFNMFVAKNGDGNYHRLFGGFTVKKVTVVMSSPSLKVVVL